MKLYKVAPDDMPRGDGYKLSITDELWDMLLKLETLSLLSESGVTLTMEEFHAIMEELRRLYDEAMEMMDYD